MTNSITTSTKHLGEPLTPDSPKGARLLVALIRGYQQLRAGRIAPCRFYPSCSHYAAEAIATHGAAKGAWLSVRRVLRCRPFGPHGIDLVPEPKKARSLQS
jgi:hypothetical protein